MKGLKYTGDSGMPGEVFKKIAEKLNFDLRPLIPTLPIFLENWR